MLVEECCETAPKENSEDVEQMQTHNHPLIPSGKGPGTAHMTSVGPLSSHLAEQNSVVYAQVSERVCNCTGRHVIQSDSSSKPASQSASDKFKLGVKSSQHEASHKSADGTLENDNKRRRKRAQCLFSFLWSAHF